MMDDREKWNRDYSSFFEDHHEEEKDKNVSDDQQEQKPVYYSYGPFRPSTPQEYDSSRSDGTGVHTPAYVTENTARVDHETVKPFRSYAEERKPKRPYKMMFASFLAGMLVIASLMFAADYFNLFTGAQSVANGAPMGADRGETAGGIGSGGSDASVQNAVWPIVRPDTIADIVEMASPAVVKIETYGTTSRTRSPFNDDFFRYFFGDGFGPPEQSDRRKLGAGSGFIFDEEGYILTNEHVISGADEIYVTVLGYKEPFKAELLGSDFDLDLAVLKIEGDEPFKWLPLGDSSKLRVGDWVTAIGNPLGFDHTVSVGVLSANEREIRIPDQQERRYREYQHLLQTDAAINQGNSGGPLLNLKGEVIGINTAVSAQAQGIGFAIPSNTVIAVLDKLKNNEPIPRPYIGVGLTDINESWLDELGLESTKGTIITQVHAGSSASRAGLRPYDVIIAMDGEEIENTQDFVDRVRQAEIGQRISLTIIRDGERFETAVTVGDRNQVQ